jgi:hypothetical protein
MGRSRELRESFQHVIHIGGTHQIQIIPNFPIDDILAYFHHVHPGDVIHHCGGNHPNATYTIVHCIHGKHSINQEEAIGHGANREEILFKFYEQVYLVKKHVNKFLTAAFKHILEM